MPINIALDGPVGAGKSSIAERVARQLGILHLDTGAMYRAFALYALQNGVDPNDEAAACALRGKAEIRVAYVQGSQRTYLNGEDVSGQIRTEEVSMAASTIAKWAGVRQYMVDLQQKLAGEADMLIDGRDIGTRVLPKAKLKIFLTASAQERARRRYEEQRARGMDVCYEDILRDVNARDAQDMNRATDPLRKAEDAVEIDTTQMGIDEVVEKIVALCHAVEGK